MVTMTPIPKSSLRFDRIVHVCRLQCATNAFLPIVNNSISERNDFCPVFSLHFWWFFATYVNGTFFQLADNLWLVCPEKKNYKFKQRLAVEPSTVRVRLFIFVALIGRKRVEKISMKFNYVIYYIKQTGRACEMVWILSILRRWRWYKFFSNFFFTKHGRVEKGSLGCQLDFLSL